MNSKIYRPRRGRAAGPHRSNGRRSPHADARGRLVDRLSVRQGRRGAHRARQPAARNADHRIDRHRRGHEIILRRRRRALSRRRECVAPDEGVGSQVVHRPMASPRSPKSRSGSTASSFATAKRSPLAEPDHSATSTWRSPRPRSASPTGPRPGRTSTASCRRSRSAFTARRRLSGTRDALGELIMTAACEANAAMAALKKSDENKFKAICTGMREDGALHRGRRERQSHRPEDRGQSAAPSGSSAIPTSKRIRTSCTGITINGVAPTYETISSFKYPGARPLYIYIKNAHAGAIPAVRAYAAEFTKESAFGPNGYLRRRA